MPDSTTFSVRPIGFVRSSLKRRAEAPKSGNEGAPDAWIEVMPAFAEGLQSITVGDDIIVLTWFHQSRRDVLKLHPVGTQTCLLRACSRHDHQTDPTQSDCIGSRFVKLLETRSRLARWKRLTARLLLTSSRRFQTLAKRAALPALSVSLTTTGSSRVMHVVDSEHYER
jgi:hypothetical protein